MSQMDLEAAIREVGRLVDPHIVGLKHVHVRVAAVRRILEAARKVAAREKLDA